MNPFVVARQAIYWIFPSAVERAAYVAEAGEVTKIGWQQSDDTLWMLKAAPSTWVQVSISGLASLRYEHTQAVASTIWTVNHNLGRNVQAEIYTVGGALIIGEILIVNSNQIQVLFEDAQSGTCVVS